MRAELTASIKGTSVRLRTSLVNTTGKPLKVQLTAPCPQGAFGVGGLPAGFDPLHTCQKGACIQPTQTLTFDLPAGRTPVEIGETTLASKGDSCNPALPDGSTFLQATVTPVIPFEVCSGAQIHLVRAKSGALRLAKLDEPAVPAKPAPAKPAPAKPAPTKAPPKAPAKPCPVCAFACTRGVPTQRKDANGCTICGCDDALGTQP